MCKLSMHHDNAIDAEVHAKSTMQGKNCFSRKKFYNVKVHVMGKKPTSKNN